MKPNFYLMNWCIRKLKHTKLVLYSFMFIGVFYILTQEKVYSQVQISDTCTVVSDTIYTMESDSLFPNWTDKAYRNIDMKVVSIGSGIIVSLDFKVNQTSNTDNSNRYTNSGLVGVENTSMLEFARIDIVQKLISQISCISFIDTFTITILQRTPCWKARYCRIPVDSFMCCNDDGNNPRTSDSGSFPNNWINYTNMPSYELIHQGGDYTDEFGNKFVYINAGKSQCGWKCCELKYKFLCRSINPENPPISTIIREFVGFERKEFENSSCVEDFEYSNPNCPHPDPANFNPTNPCTGDCNENLFE